MSYSNNNAWRHVSSTTLPCYVVLSWGHVSTTTLPCYIVHVSTTTLQQCLRTLSTTTLQQCLRTCIQHNTTMLRDPVLRTCIHHNTTMLHCTCIHHDTTMLEDMYPAQHYHATWSCLEFQSTLLTNSTSSTTITIQNTTSLIIVSNYNLSN